MNYHKYFDYSCGHLFWKTPHRKANRIKQGQRVSHINAGGYIAARIFGKEALAHRVVYEMFRGTIPEGLEIDHIDGNRTNNVPSNLRAVSRAENCRNSAKRKSSKSLLSGVYYREGSSRRRARWNAQITLNGKALHVGTFKTLLDAAAARISAQNRFNFSIRHGRTHED
jgi:hypothetical protein